MTIKFTVVDVESDPVWIFPEYQFEGVADWTQIDILGQQQQVGPLLSSPEGNVHEFEWDISRFPLDVRDTVLRLGTISHPTRVGIIRDAQRYRLDVGRVIPRRPVIETSTTSLNFPTVTLGDSVVVFVPLTNAGNESLDLTSITLPSVEMRHTPDMPLSVAPGSVDTLIVFSSLEPRHPSPEKSESRATTRSLRSTRFRCRRIFEVSPSRLRLKLRQRSRRWVMPSPFR